MNTIFSKNVLKIDCDSEVAPEQVQRTFADIDTKRKTTSYLHLKPQLIESVVEIGE